MMFVGYVEQESDSVCVWDMCTTTVLVTCDGIWLKQMFFQNVESGILQLECLHGIGDDFGSGLGLDTNDDISANHAQVNSTVISLMPGGKVTWKNTVVMTPNTSHVT
jgi:hypothetical protein